MQVKVLPRNLARYLAMVTKAHPEIYSAYASENALISWNSRDLACYKTISNGCSKENVKAKRSQAMTGGKLQFYDWFTTA
jgi:hypothetical protein